MKYQLGSQIDILDNDRFDWYFNLLDDKGRAIASVPIGSLFRYDPIVRQARELIGSLNNKLENKNAPTK